MAKGDSSGYIKLKVLLRSHPVEAIHGTWGKSSMLHHAAKYGCLQCTKLLLEAGAERTRVNGRGKNAQKLSREHGHDNLSLLIEFWDMPSWREAGGKGAEVNLDYDPDQAAKKAELERIALEQEEKRRDKFMQLQEAKLARNNDFGIVKPKVTPIIITHRSLAHSLAHSLTHSLPPYRH